NRNDFAVAVLVPLLHVVVNVSASGPKQVQGGIRRQVKTSRFCVLVNRTSRYQHQAPSTGLSTSCHSCPTPDNSRCRSVVHDRVNDLLTTTVLDDASNSGRESTQSLFGRVRLGHLLPNRLHVEDEVLERVPVQPRVRPFQVGPLTGSFGIEELPAQLRCLKPPALNLWEQQL